MSCCGNKRQMVKATAFSSSLKLSKLFLQLGANSHEKNLISYLHCKKTLEEKERKITCLWMFISFIKKEILFAWAAIITSTASNAYLHFYPVTEVWCFYVCSLGGCFLYYSYNVWSMHYFPQFLFYNQIVLSYTCKLFPTISFIQYYNIHFIIVTIIKMNYMYRYESPIP